MKTTVNPFRLSYVYIHTKSQNRCDSCTYILYTYTDFEIETWGFYRRLKDTLQYQPTSCSRASGLLASITQHVYQVGEMLSLVGVIRCFWRVLENYNCWTKFSSSHGMEYNSELYGFSAVKVKLVDGLIFKKTILSRLNSSTDADDKTI